MVKTHCTCTCIKSSKEYACYVWKHNKCAQISHIMMIWDMRTSNTLTHNHNCLIGIVTFKVHHITLSSPRNTLIIILKAFWFFFSFILFAYFLFKHIMHGHIRERNKIPNDVKLLTLHFYYAEAYRCHFMIGEQQWWDGYLCISLKIV